MDPTYSEIRVEADVIGLKLDCLCGGYDKTQSGLKSDWKNPLVEGVGSIRFLKHWYKSIKLPLK